MAISDYLRKLVELKNQLVANLKSMGVSADESEKLNTLVPKVLECKTEQNVEFNESGEIVSVILPDSTTEIRNYAFYRSPLINLTIPNSVTNIGEYAFYQCTKLESVTIPNSVTNIGTCAFTNCYGLTSAIIIRNGVTEIGDSAFKNCNKLESIIIPDSVKIIGEYAFQGCSSLANIYYTGTKEQWNAISKGFRWIYEEKPNINYNYIIWEKVQNLVRNGTIQNYYSIGDQLPVNYNGNVVMFDIVAFDVAIPANSNYTHSMTIMPHDCIDNLMIDNAEPNNSDSDIASKGNNRYAYSGIRQYLNSDKAAGEWWTAQHSTDTAPDYATTKAGFMSRLDSNFLSVIGKTKYRVAKNTITDGGGYEDLEDFFYLPSKMEVGLGTENGISEGALFPYFDSADKRIKNYGSNTQVQWWLRTPQNGVSYNTVVTGYSTGSTYIANSKSNFNIAPVCNII